MRSAMLRDNGIVEHLAGRPRSGAEQHVEVIATERLVLQRFSVAFARAVLDGNVAGFNVAAGYPHRDTPDIARSVIDEPQSQLNATWIIARRSDGVIVGDCGWFPVPGTKDAVEIGYGLAETERAQGLATEAVAALVERVWTLGVARIVATTDKENRPSARVLEKLGFRLCESRGRQRQYERFR